MSDMISRQAVLKLLSTMPPEEAITKAMLIQSVKQMDAAQPEKRTDERTGTHACDLIDRAEAIDALRTHERKPSKKWFDNQLDIEWNNAIDICCYDIEDLPSAQPERKTVDLKIEKISKHQLDFSDLDAQPYTDEEIQKMQDIEQAQLDKAYELGYQAGCAAQSERQKGEWIDYTEDGYVECPFCHNATNCDGNKDELHFCFSCGADMRKDEQK